MTVLANLGTTIALVSLEILTVTMVTVKTLAASLAVNQTVILTTLMLEAKTPKRKREVALDLNSHQKRLKIILPPILNPAKNHLARDYKLTCMPPSTPTSRSKRNSTVHDSLSQTIQSLSSARWLG